MDIYVKIDLGRKTRGMSMSGTFINIRGKTLYVEQFGPKDAPPLLYLHGGPGESCFDFSFHQKERLGNHFHVIAIDQRGVCRSEEINESEDFRLQDLIEDCEALREHLNIEKWSLIGHSFGGYLSLLYGRAYPSAIHKIIFECPTFDFKLSSTSLLQKTTSIARKHGKEKLATKCLSLLNDDSKSVKQLIEEYIEFSGELGDKRLEIYRYNHDHQTDYYAAYTEEQWETFFDRSENHFQRLREEGEIFTSILSELKKVKKPLLLLTAEHDAVTCNQQIDCFKNEVESGEIYFFENCGHTPHYEAPDRFTNVIHDFILKEEDS